MKTQNEDFAAFIGQTLAGKGSKLELGILCKSSLDAGEQQRVAVFDNRTGRPVDIDFRGSLKQVQNRLEKESLNAASNSTASKAHAADRPASGRGRPKLGVVSREISLLPRHWEWLATQRGGASASIRRLVDAERKRSSADEQIQRAIDATHRFMWDMAGDASGFEDASRALFARQFEVYMQAISDWPEDIRQQLLHYLQPAL